ncbi:MAG: hypothetical protein LUG83_00580 [Lachnospiraceae bacterium]|nr:hypothetical protein [Lachnospiraceae bacterium]
MMHESNKEIINIEDTAISFESVYKEAYFPKDLLSEIGKANMLIIPEHLVRENVSEYVFPETTREFLGYAQEKASDVFVPDIAADDDSFEKLELHSAVVTVATFIVTSIVLPIALSIVANFLTDEIKKHHRKEGELMAKINIIVADDKGNKKISYEGPADSAEDALKLAVQGMFTSNGDNNGN